MWTKKGRVLAILNGELADHPPVSAWRHLVDKEYSGSALSVEVMLDWHHTHDWDYVKLQPRASYYEEVWGGIFDFDNYEGVLPECVEGPIDCAEDLGETTVLPGDYDPFAGQIETVKAIQEGVIDDAPIFQTVMCPTSILQKLCAVNPIGRYRVASRDDPMVTLMHEQPDLVHRTLKNITDTAVAYSQKMIGNGLSGISYGTTSLSRSTYLTKEEWEGFVKPYDPVLMEILKPCKIIVHACGLEVNPGYFAHYPIDILHRSESATGNPSLDSAPLWLDKSITPIGGCNERLFGQYKAEEIGATARHTLRRMKEISFILAPSCSLTLNTYDDELRAFIAAAHE